MDIQDSNLPKQLYKKEMAEFGPDEFLQTVEFLSREKYLITCAKKKKCLVVDYSKSETTNRVVNIGFDMIGDVFFVKGTKFFGVNHPQKKIISFFELGEKACENSARVKRCNPFKIG